MLWCFGIPLPGGFVRHDGVRHGNVVEIGIGY